MTTHSIRVGATTALCTALSLLFSGVVWVSLGGLCNENVGQGTTRATVCNGPRSMDILIGAVLIGPPLAVLAAGIALRSARAIIITTICALALTGLALAAVAILAS